MENIQVTFLFTTPRVQTRSPGLSWDLTEPGAPRKQRSDSLVKEAARSTYRAMAAPAALWRLESEAGAAIFRSWGRPQQLPLLIWSGKGLEERETWPKSRDSHSKGSLGQHSPCRPSHLGVSRNIQVRNRRPASRNQRKS